MPSLPSSLALSGWPVDGSAMVAAPGRADLAAIQTAVNALIAAESGGTANQFLAATSSTAVAWAGSYTAYTPVLSSSGGGAPALGNASAVTVRYLQVGKLVHYYGTFTQGTTTSYGTGTLFISVPVTAASSNMTGVGTGTVFHLGTSGQYLTTLALVGTGVVQIIIPNGYGGVSTAVSGSTNYPWTWATGDVIAWNLTYEAA